MDMHEGGMDTVHYVGVADDPDTEDIDETMGVTTANTTPNNVETVRGTQNDDTLTAADSGVTVLGLEGDDTLTGGTGDDTLVGCKGTNTLTGDVLAVTFLAFSTTVLMLIRLRISTKATRFTSRALTQGR